MKTILAILILIFVSLTSFGQVNSNSSDVVSSDSLTQIISSIEEQNLGHFKFKGIPINGKLNEFVSKLEKKGFVVLKTTEIDAILSGRFTGEAVHIFVQAGSKNVYGVTVMYTEKPTWMSIKAQYFRVKSMLTSKYGDPIESVEQFDSPDYEESGLELFGLSEGKCTYMANFGSKEKNGMIRISISPEANLVLNYADAINYLSISKEAQDDL